MARRPELDEGGAALLGAYRQLTTCRTLVGGFGGTALGPVPWTAMRAWCDLHGLTPMVARHVIAILLQIDAAMLPSLNKAKKG